VLQAAIASLYAEAAAAYRQALDLTANEAERAFHTARLEASMS